MNKLNEKKEYNNYIFFHGVSLDKQNDQDATIDLELTIDEIAGAFTKFSRYCIAGKFNYDKKVLELGLSMIEFPYPYVKKKAREVAIKHLNDDQSSDALNIHIPFELLTEIVDYSLGNEIRSFSDLNQIFKTYNRGSLIYFFINKNLSKLKVI